MRKGTIVVGVPSAGHPKIEFVNSLVQLTASGLIDGVMIVPRLPVHQARERIATSLNGDYLLFVDDDMVFRPEDVQLLIDADKDIVSGLYLRRSRTPTPICFDFKDGKMVVAQPPEKLAPLSGSLAFTLIKKSVIEKVGTEFNFNGGKGEDINWLTRAYLAGVQPWLEPKARIGHLMEVAL